MDSMKHEEANQIIRALQAVPEGTLAAERHPPEGPGGLLSQEQLQVRAAGRGRLEAYSVFPGMEAVFHAFLSPEAAFRHGPTDSVLEIYYCHSGRVGWNMQGGTAVYLGTGDLTVHSMACCADSVMMFPLGYSDGISISVDLERLAAEAPEILREANVQPRRLRERFCTPKPTAIPACPQVEHIFAPLCAALPSVRPPLLKLKVQELLIFLSNLEPDRRELTQYFSRQTEQIKEIHQLLTEHLDQRFTIEELSKRYLINTSTLKEVFKAVYGLPIATYMKEYRVRQAMKLLRETDAPIARVAQSVGYETQGKFTKAFKDVAQMLPTEYRKTHSPR